MTDAYAAAGVDTRQADRGVAALVSVLSSIETGRERLSVPLPGHYASVIRIAPNLGVALATDSVGSKVIVAEQAQRFSTIGIDCVAMNVNDLICVGAEPLALLDYLAVESADPALLAELAEGLRAGAEDAGVEIPGGEVCQLPEVIRGHPSPYGFDLVGSAFGTVALDAIVDGRACAPGDAVIGLPASGVHSNGLTLARRVLLDEAGLSLDARPAGLEGASVADALLEPTVIYVRAVLELLRSDIPVHGLAHITGGGLLNLLRLRRPASGSRSPSRCRCSPCSRSSPSSATSRPQRCGRSSTWAAASAPWCRSPTPSAPSRSSRTVTPGPRSSAGSPTPGAACACPVWASKARAGGSERSDASVAGARKDTLTDSRVHVRAPCTRGTGACRTIQTDA